jgi:hypothetical protein
MNKSNIKVRYFIIAWLVSTFPFYFLYLSENEKVVIVPATIKALVILSVDKNDKDDKGDKEKRRR